MHSFLDYIMGGCQIQFTVSCFHCLFLLREHGIRNGTGLGTQGDQSVKTLGHICPCIIVNILYGIMSRCHCWNSRSHILIAAHNIASSNEMEFPPLCQEICATRAPMVWRTLCMLYTLLVNCVKNEAVCNCQILPPGEKVRKGSNKKFVWTTADIIGHPDGPSGNGKMNSKDWRTRLKSRLRIEWAFLLIESRGHPCWVYKL